MSRKILIGLGHKARQGKDYIAEYLKANIHFAEVEIVHFVDGLYEELSNNSEPLIVFSQQNISLWNGKKYDVLPTASLPSYFVEWLADHLTDNLYFRMYKKEPVLLQFWGTDYRRRLYGYDYWINRTAEKINSLSSSNYQIILIPDTRFKNEYNFIRQNDGYYIEVVRLNENGEQYISRDRNPNHISEIDLDDMPADYTVIAVDKDLKSLCESSFTAVSRIYDSIVQGQLRGDT